MTKLIVRLLIVFTLLSNLGWAADQQAAIPLEIVQVDDGYQAAEAEMLETNERFPASN